MQSFETRDPDRRPNSRANDVRREHRYQCAVTQVSVNLGNDSLPFPAVMLDLSKSGLRLRAERRLDPGQHLTISWTGRNKSTIISGESRFCHSLADHLYDIGIRIADVNITPILS
jgi:hypothetical protein